MDEQGFIESSIDLQAAFQELSEDEQSLIWLWAVGFTQLEIAEQFAITQPAVSQKIAAILEKLKEAL